MDIICADEFIPESVKFTNRAYFMAMLHSAFEYIEDLTEDKLEELKQSIRDRQSKESECLSDFEEDQELVESTHEETKVVAQKLVSKKAMNAIIFEDYFYPTPTKPGRVEACVRKGDLEKHSSSVRESLHKSFCLFESFRSDSIQMHLNFYKSNKKSNIDDQGNSVVFRIVWPPFCWVGLSLFSALRLKFVPQKGKERLARGFKSDLTLNLALQSSEKLLKSNGLTAQIAMGSNPRNEETLESNIGHAVLKEKSDAKYKLLKFNPFKKKLFGDESKRTARLILTSYRRFFGY